MNGIYSKVKLHVCIWDVGVCNVRAASQRVCESASCKSASMRVASLGFATWKFASHIIWKKELPEKVVSDTYLSQVKYWHVASLGIKLSKAGNNKGADIRTFFFACHKLGFLMTWLRLVK